MKQFCMYCSVLYVLLINLLHNSGDGASKDSSVNLRLYTWNTNLKLYVGQQTSWYIEYRYWGGRCTCTICRLSLKNNTNMWLVYLLWGFQWGSFFDLLLLPLCWCIIIIWALPHTLVFGLWPHLLFGSCWTLHHLFNTLENNENIH